MDSQSIAGHEWLPGAASNASIRDSSATSMCEIWSIGAPGAQAGMWSAAAACRSQSMAVVITPEGGTTRTS